MDQDEGESVRSSRDLLEPDVQADPPKTTSSSAATPRSPAKRSNVVKKEKVSHNGLPAQTNSCQVGRRSLSLKGGTTPRPPRPLLQRPLSLEITPQHLRGAKEQMMDRRIVQPPWRSGLAAPLPPTRSLTSPSLGAGGWMRRSESTCSVNYSLGVRGSKGQMRPATSLPHIAKGLGSTTLANSSRPCLLVALRPLNLEQEKQAFFQSDYKYEPQFEYTQPEPRNVLDKYREGSGLFLEQVTQDQSIKLRV